jgi:hypothetical protein
VRTLVVTALLVTSAALYGDEHDKKLETGRAPASVRAEVGKDTQTASDSVLDELQSSVDDLYSVIQGGKAKASPTGEVNRPPSLWSIPK